MNLTLNEMVEPLMDKLFVYGIFLDERNRNAYGMSNPHYATVAGYITIGSRIVQAVRADGLGAALTGLLVDVEPDQWPRIDMLESGYDRITITTTDGIEAYMYAG